jgi:lipopolysaccharide/colanic/teichoic acid biosynthesis glycosyltransferase
MNSFLKTQNDSLKDLLQKENKCSNENLKRTNNISKRPRSQNEKNQNFNKRATVIAAAAIFLILTSISMTKGKALIANPKLIKIKAILRKLLQLVFGI